MDGQDAFLDDRIGPHVREELVLGDETPGVSDQHDQDVVGFRREPNDLSSMTEPPLGGLQRELAKMKDFPAVHDDLGES